MPRGHVNFESLFFGMANLESTEETSLAYGPSVAEF